MLVHVLDEELHVLDGRPREDSVSEVENVSRTTRRLSQNQVDPIEKDLLRREERERIEVALDRDALSDFVPAPIEIDTPIETDDVPSRLAHLSKDP